jgi:hypothetical protein
MRLKAFKSGFQMLSGTHLDLNFRANSTLGVIVIERPGIHWSKELILQTQLDMRDLAKKGNNGKLPDYGLLSDDLSSWDSAILVLLRDHRKEGKLIAFNALRILDLSWGAEPMQAVHLGFVMVDIDARGEGFSWLLGSFPIFALAIRGVFEPKLITNVSQIPAVLGMFGESFSGVFPDIANGTRVPLDAKLIASEIMEKHRSAFGVGTDADFDAEEFVIKDSYTGGSDHLKKTFIETPKHRKDIYNEKCRRLLDYNRGDDFLQIGWFDAQAMGRFILKDLPKNASIAILFQFLGLFVLRIFLPAWKWLSGVGGGHKKW